MSIDQNTARNLELFAPLNASGGSSLLGVLDETKTAMGARLLRRWVGQPLLDITTIARRQDSVALFFASGVCRGRTAALLSKIPDLERLRSRVSTAAAGAPGVSAPRDLAALGRGLAVIPTLREVVVLDATAESRTQSVREELIAELHACEEAVDVDRGGDLR